MTSLTAGLKAILAEHVRQHRIVVWYDPGGTLRGCFPEAVPDGTDSYVHEGTSLGLRVAFEEANPMLERPSVIYLPAAPEDPSWLRDLELAGCRRELGLNELLVEAFHFKLEAALREALNGPVGTRLAASWSELLPDEVTVSTSDLRIALLAAALDLHHRSLEDLLLTFVSDLSAESRLARAGLLPQLHAVLHSEEGWPSDSVASVNGQSCAAALLLSEAATSGGLNTDGLGKVLPKTSHRGQWAAWAEKWRRLDPRSFAVASEEVERAYGVKARLRGIEAAAIQSFRSVDEVVLAAIEAKVEVGEVETALEPARQRARSHWAEADRNAQTSQPWDAVVAALEVRQWLSPAMAELTGRPAWALAELLERYSDAETGWWRIDDAYRRLDAHRNRLPAKLASALGAAAARSYWEWIDALGMATGRCLRQGEWSADGWRRQGVVALEAVGRKRRTAILLADALRFDLAMSLASKLEGRGVQVSQHRSLGVLPSVTVVGMAAILGSTDIEAEISGGQLVPRVNGTVLHGRAERLVAFRQRFPKATAIELSDVRKGRPIPKGAEILIVYMQDIDEQGDFLPQVGRDHFEALTREIAEGIDALLKAGYRSVLVIPDHGFLLLPEDPPPRVLPVKVGADTARARRYLVGKPPEIEGAVRVPLETLGWHSTAVAAFPLGAAVFGIAGEVPRYLHGGPTLQETALLALTAERLSAAAPVGVRIVEPGHIDTVLPRFVLEGDAAGDLLTEPRRVRVIIRSDGKVVGESEVVTITAGDRVGIQVRLQEYGTAVEAIVEDYATRDELVKKSLAVALPAGYEDLEL